MKQVFFILFLGFTTPFFSQGIDYNEQKNYIASGYDVVAYFSNTAVKGVAKYTHNYKGAAYKFSTKENLATFIANSKKYVPQYAGWCAYAMADKGKKVTINPKTFEIRNGKLYLFYNAYFTNTYESWIEKKPEELIKKANVNWEKIKFKS